MAEQTFQALTVDQQEPVATVTAEVTQNAAGAWRASAKVTIVAPIKLYSHIDEERTYAEADAKMLEVTGSAATEGGCPEVSIRSYTHARDYDLEPLVIVTTPSAAETAVSTAVTRMLQEAAATAFVIADMYNAESANDVKVKSKKGE